jgi:hypothetical protein
VGLEPSTRTHLQARGAQDQQAPRRAPLALRSGVDGVAMDMFHFWWFGTFFFPQIMIPTDFHIFQSVKKIWLVWNQILYFQTEI